MPPKKRRSKRKNPKEASSSKKQSRTTPHKKTEQLTTLPTNFHDMYLEITDHDFKFRPKDILKLPFLSDEWVTERMYRLPSYLAGTYLMFDLHKNPHYQLSFNQRENVELKARDKEIPLIEIPKEDFEIENDIYHYSNETSIFKQFIESFKKDFELEHVINFLDKQKVCGRGNHAKSIGWRNNSLKFQIKLAIPV